MYVDVISERIPSPQFLFHRNVWFWFFFHCWFWFYHFHSFEMDENHSTGNSNMLTMTNEWVSVKHGKGDRKKVKASPTTTFEIQFSSKHALFLSTSTYLMQSQTENALRILIQSAMYLQTLAGPALDGRYIWPNRNFSRKWYGKSKWCIHNGNNSYITIYTVYYTAQFIYLFKILASGRNAKKKTLINGYSRRRWKKNYQEK